MSKSMHKDELIIPEWNAPEWVRACCTTRQGGVSVAPYDSMNLALHVGDDEQAVQTNRERLQTLANLPATPVWLEQIHSKRVIHADAEESDLRADGSFSSSANSVCVVMTADCLPVLLVNRKQRKVAALHAGWKGLAGGILEQGVELVGSDDCIAWMGPAIGPQSFEVGKDVYDAFVSLSAEHSQAFTPCSDDKWLADIYCLARQKLQTCAVAEISGGGFCTFQEKQRFYSYRRDKITGRMASLIWIID